VIKLLPGLALNDVVWQPVNFCAVYSSILIISWPTINWGPAILMVHIVHLSHANISETK